MPYVAYYDPVMIAEKRKLFFAWKSSLLLPYKMYSCSSVHIIMGTNRHALSEARLALHLWSLYWHVFGRIRAWLEHYSLLVQHAAKVLVFSQCW